MSALRLTPTFYKQQHEDIKNINMPNGYVFQAVENNAIAKPIESDTPKVAVETNALIIVGIGAPAGAWRYTNLRIRMAID